MNRLRSGPLAAWATAWLAGATSSDEVISAVTGGDAPHTIAGLPGTARAPLSQALIDWRASAQPVLLVLPVPGDVRGLPGPASFRSAALDAGEAVHAGGLGMVPDVIEHAPSSAPTTVVWRASVTDVAPADYIGLAEAEHDLTTAVRECAGVLSAAQVAGWVDGADTDLDAARHAGERLNLPPGHPPRAVALLAQAERLHAVLQLAARDPVGGAIDRLGVSARAEALRILAIAVRRARLAGYNANAA